MKFFPRPRIAKRMPCGHHETTVPRRLCDVKILKDLEPAPQTKFVTYTPVRHQHHLKTTTLLPFLVRNAKRRPVTILADRSSAVFEGIANAC